LLVRSEKGSAICVRSQVTATPADGVALAAEVQRRGDAASVLARWVEVSTRCAAAERAATDAAVRAA
jgi:hypothetical protein